MCLYAVAPGDASCILVRFVCVCVFITFAMFDLFLFLLPRPPPPPPPPPPLVISFPPCFRLPPPQMDNSVVVDDYQQIDRILKEERKYILNLLKPIIKSGCNVLLIQKSILRDAVNDLSLHYLVR